MAPLRGTAKAQSKTIIGDTKVVTATIEAIERSSRSLTLKQDNGEYVTITVPPEVAKFDAMKVGDKITARYYDNVVVRLKAPGEKDKDSDTAALTGTAGKKPGAHRRHAAHDHRDHHAARSQDPLDHVHRTERLEVQLAGRGQGGDQEGEGRRQGRHHVDRGGAGLGRAAEEVKK